MPLDKIESAAWHKTYDDFGGMWRLAGTAAPGVLLAGHYRQHGQTDFLFLRRPRGFWRVRADNVLAICTSIWPKRILLTMPEAEAKSIIRAVGHE